MDQCAGPARSDRRDRQRVPSSGQQQQQQPLPQQQGTLSAITRTVHRILWVL